MFCFFVIKVANKHLGVNYFFINFYVLLFCDYELIFGDDNLTFDIKYNTVNNFSPKTLYFQSFSNIFTA